MGGWVDVGCSLFAFGVTTGTSRVEMRAGLGPDKLCREGLIGTWVRLTDGGALGRTLHVRSTPAKGRHHWGCSSAVISEFLEKILPEKFDRFLQVKGNDNFWLTEQYSKNGALDFFTFSFH